MHAQSEVFAELNGVVLVNANRLSRHVGDASDLDLLGLFSSTDLGDRACADGAVVPAIGLAPEFYLVTVRESEPGTLAREAKQSAGWVFCADKSPSLLCGLGYLARWDPKEPKHRRISIDPGWYSVELRGGIASDGRWALEFVLNPSPTKPPLIADPSVAFDLYLDEL